MILKGLGTQLGPPGLDQLWGDGHHPGGGLSESV